VRSPCRSHAVRPDGVRLRVDDCTPRLLLTQADKADTARGLDGLDVVVADDAFVTALARYPTHYEVRSTPDDLAVFQYTSAPRGSCRRPCATPTARSSCSWSPRSTAPGSGPGDRFFCPSSPAWGHGLWHGTLAPLALGVTTGTMGGKLTPCGCSGRSRSTTSPTCPPRATHYRMLKSSGETATYRYAIRKLSFTGEPMDSATRAFVEDAFPRAGCSMYGTTEVGVILADYPGAADYAVKPGALGKPVPGVRVEVQGVDARPCRPTRSARSRSASGCLVPGRRTSATSTTMATTTMPGGRTTSSSPRAGP